MPNPSQHLSPNNSVPLFDFPRPTLLIGGVEILLDHPLVRHDKRLIKIFRIIELDEPSHWAPYDHWLQAYGGREAAWWERAIDSFIHAELLFIKLPFLFLNPWLKRRTRWADDQDPAEPLASPIPAAA